MSELKPCPFCGGEAESENGFSPMESIFYVWCSNEDCYLSPRYDGSERMFTVEQWNTRTLSPEITRKNITPNLAGGMSAIPDVKFHSHNFCEVVEAAKHIKAVSHSENCTCNLCRALSNINKDNQP
jgi:hypothetical protein